MANFLVYVIVIFKLLWEFIVWIFSGIKSIIHSLKPLWLWLYPKLIVLGIFCLIFMGISIVSGIVVAILKNVPILSGAIIISTIVSFQNYFDVSVTTEKIIILIYIILQCLSLPVVIKCEINKKIRKLEDYQNAKSCLMFSIIVHNIIMMLLKFNIYLKYRIHYYITWCFFILVFLASFSYLVKCMDAIKTIKSIEKWKKEGIDLNINPNTILTIAIDNFKHYIDSYFDYSNMPYGRAVSFISNFEKGYLDDDIYFFAPKSTINPYEVRENGFLITKTGLYIIREIKNKDGKYIVNKDFLNFKDIYLLQDYKVTLVNSQEDGFIEIDISNWGNTDEIGFLYSVLYAVYINKLPQYFNYYGLSNEINFLFEDEINFSNEKTKENKIFIDSGIINSIENRNQIYNEVKNYMNGKQGHGYAAEYANITVDRIKSHVKNEAQNLDINTGRQMRDGADKIVNGEYIQVKYTKNYENLHNSIFSDGELRYKKNGEPMKIEVPKDKYIEYVNELQKKVDSGECVLKAGYTAKDIIIKGHITYDTSIKVAKAGTIEGLKYDMINGVQTSIDSATLSSIVAFANAVWNGRNLKEAAYMSFETEILTIGKSAAIFTTTMQLTRSNIAIPIINKDISNPILKISSDITDNLKNSYISKTQFGKSLSTITEKALISNTITCVITLGPDIYKYFSGKISNKQLFKNTSIIAGGLGGSIIFKSFGPIGSIMGGIIGSIATKEILDKYILDDAIEMFCILKEEFIDQVTLAYLNNEEFKLISDFTISNSELHLILENMYSKVDPRQFAREYVSECIIEIYKSRKKITNKSIIHAYSELFSG